MSKARRPEENLESPLAIRALFQKLAEGGAGSVHWHDVWLALVSDLWVQAEVVRRARHYAADHQLSDEAVRDIAQDVFLLLAAKVAGDTSLHANVELLPEKFCGWLGTIIDHLCSDAARRCGCYRRPPGRLDDAAGRESAPLSTDRVFDVADAVGRLEGRERSVMLMFLSGLPREKIAETLHLSYKQVIGSINRSKPALRKKLAAYRDERS